MKRLILTISVLVIPWIGCSPNSTQGPPAGTFSVQVEEVSLADGTSAKAEHGVLQVPVRRNTAASGTVALEVYRFPAASEVAADRPPIFLLNGGPGYPGLGPALSREGFYERRIAPWTQVADVVVVGQRGIGSSSPNTECEGPGPVPFDKEMKDKDWVELVQRTARRCRERWESEGLDLQGFTVIEAAADLEDVRKALGYGKITVLGGSFGSHWGMAFMRYFPDSVERAILHGMEGPNHTYDSPSGVLRALERIAGAAESDPNLEERIPEGGLIEALRTVIGRFERKPIYAVTTDSQNTDRRVWIGPDDVRSVALGLGSRVSSRAGMPGWPIGIIRMHEGDYLPLARTVLRRREDGSSFPTASFFMLDCGSGISPERLEQLRSDPAIEVVGDLSEFYETACPVWESDLGDEFRKNFDTDIPTVIVHGTWDTSTPLENAMELKPHFKNSHMVLVEGGSHGALAEALDADESFRAALHKFAGTGDWSDLADEVVLPPVRWLVLD